MAPPELPQRPFHSIVFELDVLKVDDAADAGNKIVEKAKAILSDPEGLKRIDSVDDCGQCALHLCAKQCAMNMKPGAMLSNPAKTALAKLLVVAGAELELRDQFGATPLHIATMTSEPDGSITKVLCEAGADVNAVENHFGSNALHLGCATGLPMVLEPLLKAPGAKEALEAKDNGGALPIEIAKKKAAALPYPFKSSAELVRMIEAFKKKK